MEMNRGVTIIIPVGLPSEENSGAPLLLQTFLESLFISFSCSSSSFPSFPLPTKNQNFFFLLKMELFPFKVSFYPFGNHNPLLVPCIIFFQIYLNLLQVSNMAFIFILHFSLLLQFSMQHPLPLGCPYSLRACGGPWKVGEKLARCT